MSQLAQALSQAAEKNSELLYILAETDYAPSSLHQNQSYVSDLKGQISSTETELKKLHAITEDERKDHLKYRDSTVKRFMHKLGGQKGKDKFSSKAEKEEREFLEAWQKEREASESKEELEKALARAESDQPGIQHEVRRHDDAQRELDILYQHIFSGPTPEVPGEDQLERAVESCRQRLDSCQNDAGQEKYAMDALQEALHTMSGGLDFMNKALNASDFDMMGGGTFADMMERDALSNAQKQIMHAMRHFGEARRVQPAIKELPNISIDQGHFMSDVVFDNIFSDMKQHDRMEKSLFQMRQAFQQLHYRIDEQKSRVQATQGQAQQSGNDLESARRELQNIRAQAFEQYANSGAGGPPPSYQP